MAHFEFVSGDTASSLKITCKDNDTEEVIDLTGSTVRLKWVDKTQALISRVMTVATPTNGIAIYQFLADELAVGTMKFEAEITESSGKVMRNLKLINVPVRKSL